jgi:prolipoprotein diacylglyceryl transferase
LFALGFVIGQAIIFRVFKDEGKPEKDVETLTMFMVISTILGARLGHCLFYDPVYYLSHPLEILFVWKGGLASHGATIGILTAIAIYVNYRITATYFLGLIPYRFQSLKVKRPGQSYLWVLDRIVIVTALAGALIRLGNLMNSEIIGLPADVPWAFVFESVDQQPRHPAQLYESLSCLALFFVLLYLWSRRKQRTPEGLLFSIFLIVVFGLRFFYEFLKENQSDFEEGLLLNMGQTLSIPLVLAGFYVMYRSLYKPFKPHPAIHED